jgi:hypothetical protein
MLLGKNKKINKITLAIVTLVFILSNFYFVFGWHVQISYAQWIVYDPVSHAFQTSTNILEKIWDEIKAIFFKNVLGTFANKIAEQTAIWVAAGGKGAKPQFITDFKQFTQGIADAAIGDFIQTMMKDLTGIDICTLDPRIALNVVLSIPTFPGYTGPTPNCTWTQMRSHWEEIGKSQLITFNATLQQGGEFGQNTQLQQATILNNPTLQCWNMQLVTAPAIPPATGTKNYIGNCAGYTTNAACAGAFCTKPGVQTILESSANTLSTYSSELSSDVNIMTSHALDGTSQAFSSGIGTYEVVSENIPIIRDKWLAKIDKEIAPLDGLIAKYQPCQSAEGIQFISGGNCSAVATELSLSVSGVDFNNPKFASLPGVVKSEMNAKASYVVNSAQSIKSAYDYLKSQVTQKFNPDFFEGGVPYNARMAEDFFNPNAFEFNAFANIEEQINKVGLQTYLQQTLDLVVNQGWKTATDTIANTIRTPSNLLREKAAEDLKSGKVASSYTKNIAADALGVFLETLWNQYTQRLLQGLSNPGESQKSKEIAITVPGATPGKSSSRYSQEITTLEGVSKYIQEIGRQFQANYTYKNISLLADFQMNLQGLVNPNIYNNVIDSNFAQAINDKQTIAEAIDSGRLMGSFRFSWGDTPEPGTYHLANIKKLRKARVLPIGLEMAVELIKACNADINSDEFKTECQAKIPTYADINFIKNATLKDVVDGFDKPGSDGICGKWDNLPDGTPESGESPFCNLVNPNWVLKIPLTKCSYEADLEPYGEILQSNNSSQRYSRCTDFASCLQEDGKGGCVNEQYGFCVKEKNVWRLTADSCPKDYESCRTYSIKQGETTSIVSYLKNTLPGADICNSGNAGCLAYAYERIGNSWNPDKKVYLDGSAETCELANEGCSLFWPGGDLVGLLGEKAPLYYKKPPAYLGCTGSANDDPNCKNFMTVCNSAEVGCQFYKPVNGDPIIPAVARSTDLCPAECNGYNVYVQQPTAYEPQPANSGYNYFIPETATSCELAEVGCSQFTNLDEVAKGGEGIHYYTYLKQCIKPNLGLGEKSFFTWQSSATGSPKIIRYQLQQDMATGAPKTIDNSGDCSDTPGDKNCKSSNPNCLKFYDDAGNYYCRDVSQTIAVSDDCHPLRKADSDKENCEATNGKWQDNACIYNAIPAENLVCRAEAAGCRAYTGNRGNNVYNLINDDFENTSAGAAGWSAGSLSTESTALGGHSLLVGAGSTLKSAALFANNLYTISFWAKTDNENGENITVGFNALTGSSKTFKITALWQNFTLGPIAVDADYPNNNLFFSNITQNIYLDNIIVKKISSQIYVVKNSWKTPASCDMPTTGAMLGCEAYQNSAGQTLYLKSFSNLCSEDKVGCQLLIDTQNSQTVGMADYRDGQLFAYCQFTKDQSGNTICADTTFTPAKTDNCEVKDGDCVVKDILPTDYIVPADAQVTYVLNDKFKCQPANKGCQRLGKPVSVNFVDAYLKNDPDKYNTIMCTANAVGCVELINSTGGSEYYKIDPLKICTYDEASEHWLLGGSGCYSSVAGIDDQYKILPTTDPNYAGYIGACPDKYNGCTRFGTYSQPQGNQAEELLDENYYVIDNGNNLDRSSCGGVDWNAGCVKFKNYDTGDSEILKVKRDRDCDEWLVCKEKDANGLCRKAALCDQIKNGQCAQILEPCKKSKTDCNFTDWSLCETCFINHSCTSTACSQCNPPNFDLSCSTIANNCRANGTCIQPQPTCAFENHICLPKDDCEIDGLGNCVSIYDKLKDNVRYNYAGVGIPIERIAAKNQGYIYRMAAGSSLAIDLTTWQAGDYSGYSVPDRYPLEMELEFPAGTGFKLYPKVAEIGSNPDFRYEEPICKYFPASDSPMPYEMRYVSKNKQLTNLYSPSYQADLKSLGSMCSYAEVKASGVTTYFPLNFGDNQTITDVKDICTYPEYRQGKWCSGQTITAPDDNTSFGECPYSDTNKAGSSSVCSKVENMKIYNGIEGMCLEYDTLSPVYADVYKTYYDGTYMCNNPTNYSNDVSNYILVGDKERKEYCEKNNGLYDNGGKPKYNYQTYACLTYLPFAIDVCPYHKTEASCNNNPQCNWGFCYSSENGKIIVQANYPNRTICNKGGYIWSDGPCIRKQ